MRYHDREKVGGLKGVAKVNVNPATNHAHVEYNPEEISLQGITDSIKSAGYRVGKESLKLGIGGMYCASCVTKIEDELKHTPRRSLSKR